ncbi:MAG: type IX secretion system outer membrane channel protein PorV [Candidatus Cyclobacteriaceae bacterium M3_2C_046]
MSNSFKTFVWLVVGLLSVKTVNAQFTNPNDPTSLLGQDSLPRVITTAVPFMMISPDARAGAMGDVGAATTPDANSVHWNPAKIAFMEKDFGFSLSYTPWLGKIIDDMSISYLSAFKKITREQAVAIELRYFDLGEIVFNTGPGEGDIIGEYNPREFAIGGTYSRMLVENTFGIGVSARYIHSNLTGNVFIPNIDAKPGQSVAADIGVYYNKDLLLSGTNSNIAFGAIISNIGAKITYSNDDQRQFIPTNLRIGTAFTTNLDPYNSLTFAVDFNKLMVPTPPLTAVDSTGETFIVRGKDPDRALLSGMFGSFIDAPDGFSEELQEVMISGGAEYWYNDVFAARAGYFFENRNKGDRNFFTLGLGFRYQVFGIDFAYLVPTAKQHPLAETLRFSMVFNWDGDRNKTIRN